MPVFEYIGLDAAGKPAKGVIDAETPKSARTRLRKQNVFPTDVWLQQKGATRGTGINVSIDFSKYFQRVTSEDLATMTTQMSTLVGASIPVVEALTALVEQTENPKLKAALVDIRGKVNEGISMAKAMRAHPTIFSDLYVNMVDAGEQSGAMEQVLQRLEAYTRSQEELRSKVFSALTYPVLMMSVSTLMVLGLFAFVVPRLRRIFDSFGKEVPFTTRMVFGFSDFILSPWTWGVGIVVIPLLLWGVWRYIHTTKGREKWHRLQLRVPVFGRLNRLVGVSRFCRTLATLLSSGVPVLTALNITKSVVGNDIIAAAVESAARNISEGQSIATPLKQSGEFPPIVTHMITIGEKTGELETMLNKVADAYDSQVESAVNALTSLLTPVLVLVMGGVVFVVALGVIMPMMSLTSAIH